MNFHPAPVAPRILALADHATAELHAGNLPVAPAASAADLLHCTPYTIGATRPRALRVLDEHLAA